VESPKKSPAAKFLLPNAGKPELVPYEELVAFSTGELDASASAIVQLHVSSCDACAREVKRLRSVHAKSR
jgi:anti-sigma factor RsiW